MNRFLTMALLATAACTSARKEEAVPVLPDGREVIATFTAEADLAAGTLTVRTLPVATGPSGSKGTLNELTDVSVTTESGTYVQDVDGTGACAGRKVWGATVDLTKVNGALSYLGGVYAYITEWTGGEPLESCNKSPSPPGMTSTWGIWSYDSVTDTPTGHDWYFPFTTATRYSFKGIIVGAKVLALPVDTGTIQTTSVMKSSGSRMVAGVPNGIAFLNSSGTFTKTSNLSNAVIDLAPDPVNDRIWYLVAYDIVGFTNGTGGSPIQVQWTACNFFTGVCQNAYRIVRDANDKDVAWVITQGDFVATGQLRKVTFSNVFPPGVVTVGDPVTISIGRPTGVASDGTSVWVTVNSANRIQQWDVTTDPPTLTASWPTFGSPGCVEPENIMYGPGGKIWFTGYDSLCTIDTGGNVATAWSSSRVKNLCVGPDGNVWFLQGVTGTSRLARFVEGQTTAWTIQIDYGPGLGNQPSCASGLAGFWTMPELGANSVFKVQP